MAPAGDAGDPCPRTARGSHRHDPTVPELRGDLRRGAEGAPPRDRRRAPACRGGIVMTLTAALHALSADLVVLELARPTLCSRVRLPTRGGTVRLLSRVAGDRSKAANDVQGHRLHLLPRRRPRRAPYSRTDHDRGRQEDRARSRGCGDPRERLTGLPAA